MSKSCQRTSPEAVVHNRACVYPVPHVSLRIDDAQPIDGGIKQLLKYIRPEWPTERVQFKVTFLLQSETTDMQILQVSILAG